MSHAQVLLDRTDAPDSLWFLAQDYLAHAHNLSANRQIDLKILELTDHSTYPNEGQPNWKDLFPDAEEEIPNVFSYVKGTKNPDDGLYGCKSCA
jgi:hypothetical protein